MYKEDGTYYLGYWKDDMYDGFGKLFMPQINKFK